MPSRTVLIRVRAASSVGAVLCALALELAGNVGEAAAARAKVATCDQAAGVTAYTSTKWRLFRPHPSTAFDDPGAIWVCRRGPGPARRFAALDYIYRSVSRIGGDLAQISNSGRYNPETYVLNLATLRSLVIEDDWLSRGLLTGSGAIVSQTRATDPKTGHAVAGLPAVVVDDAAGRHELLTGAALDQRPAATPPVPSPAAGTAGSFDRAVAVSGEDELPGAVTYASATDGGPVRFMPTGAANSAAWATREMHFVSRTLRRRTTHGVSTRPLLGAGYELSERRASNGRPASLSIRRPASIAYDDWTPKHASDLVARLAPGSGADARVTDGGVVVARFADHPDELRARLPTFDGTGHHSVVDLPATLPAAVGPIAVSPGSRTVAIATADAITLVLRDEATGDRFTRTLPIAGATQLALYVTASGRTYDHVLYWTDADGKPVSTTFSTPES